MDNVQMTRHANERSQQRGIPPFVIDLLLDFGESEHDHHGGEIRYFGKQGKRRVVRHLGQILASRLDSIWDAYAVTADGVVVTAGHRTARVRRIS